MRKNRNPIFGMLAPAVLAALLGLAPAGRSESIPLSFSTTARAIKPASTLTSPSATAGKSR